MTETKFQSGDKVVVKKDFSFHLHGIGLDVPVVGKVYCVSEVLNFESGPGLVMVGMQNQIAPNGFPWAFESVGFKKVSS